MLNKFILITNAALTVIAIFGFVLLIYNLFSKGIKY